MSIYVARTSNTPLLTAPVKSSKECEFLMQLTFSVSIFILDNRFIFFNLKLLPLEGNGAYDEVTSQLIFSGSSCYRSPLVTCSFEPLSLN